jgi:outer membrane protein TolC
MIESLAAIDMRALIYTLMLAAIQCLLSIAHADSPTVPESGYDLGGLYHCAYVYLRQTEGQALIDSAAAITQAFRQSFLPSVSANLTYNNSFSQPDISVPPALYTGSVTLNQQLINFAQWKNIQARRQGGTAAELELENTLQELLRTLGTSYAEALSLQERERILQRRLKRHLETLAFVQELRKLNIQNREYSFIVQAEKIADQSQIMQIQSDRLKIFSDMRSLLGFTGERELLLRSTATPKEIAAQPTSLTPEQIEKIIENQPAIYALVNRRQESESEATSASMEALPTMNVTGAFSRSIYPSDNPIQQNNFSSFGVIATVSLPIFDQGLRQVKHAQASAHADLIEMQTQRKRIELKNSLQSLAGQLTSDRAALNASIESLRLAQIGYDDSWTVFSMGQKDFLNLKVAEDSLIQSELAEIDAERRFNEDRAVLDLEMQYQAGRKATPQPIPVCE